MGTETSDQTDDLHLDQQLCFPITVASRLLVQAYKGPLEPLGLTHPQYLVMLALWDHWQDNPSAAGTGDSGISASDLAKLLNFEMATLTLLLRRLEKRDLVTRVPDPNDERRRYIHLTRAGIELRATAKDVPTQMRARLGLDSAELEAITRASQKLVDALTHDDLQRPAEHVHRGTKQVRVRPKG
ncbi:MarR family transcriptional regulator [Brevibacterium sp. 50QC2O2]|uniref:MarR family winged helix-turn-helix transcriptional regulator n=1 Tax=Brevibacterium TaxID=1696 RepID=UPI00211C1810|nr:MULTISPECIES: MarR family transcriptional regulator [unclassified Brevibacterium]MCQ9368041.1 MarR family transcriptional regulator [Brevibacterium sp. 91QC2O2]MCQ9385243.1 MarR family transcriptional regulator [Brevibacterium sp. 68QC2CO]MCQ9388749.1 MarR family transcriptional regulator [Brevibacterium sp. 50QC2O2]